MLSTILDRLAAPVALYLFAVWTVLQAQPYIHSVAAYSILAVLTVYTIRNAVQHIIYERRIDALGSRAPVLRTWTPFNAWMVINNVLHLLRHENHKWWLLYLGKMASPANPTPRTFETIAVGERVIITVDEENVKAILATQFQDYGKGPQFRAEWKPFLGLSIFTTDGDLWHSARQLIRPQFIKDRVSDLHTFEKHVTSLLKGLAGAHEGATVRADDLFFRYTLDAATDFLLGRSVGSLENPQAGFAYAFAKVQYVQSLIVRAGPLQGFVSKKEYYDQLIVIDEFVGQFIERALQLSPEELEKKTKSDEGYTFLHALASYTRDRAMLRDQLVAVLLAGRDTTASTLSWLFYELSCHPHVVQRLRREIINRVGLERKPTYDDLKSMRYLQHTLNEILRLYPSVPYNVRMALKDTTLPRGGGVDGSESLGVLEGTPVAYSAFVLQRRKDIYPPVSEAFPDPDKFAPERWDEWTPKAWTYIPFNGGPRICVGQQFALTEMGYTIVRILQSFDRIECKTPDFPMMRTEIVLQPAHGVYVAFHPAGRME